MQVVGTNNRANCVKKSDTISPRSYSSKPKEILYYMSVYFPLSSYLCTNLNKIFIFEENMRTGEKLFFHNAESLTSVYSCGDIQTVAAFHHKAKTKLTVFIYMLRLARINFPFRFST